MKRYWAWVNWLYEGACPYKRDSGAYKELFLATEAQAEIGRYDLALQSLTPGGSEFVNDPERCVQFVKDIRHANFEMIKKQKAEIDNLLTEKHETEIVVAGIVQERDRSRAEIDRLRAAAKSFRDLCACYRVGKRPSEALWKRLEEAAKTMEEHP